MKSTLLFSALLLFCMATNAQTSKDNLITTNTVEAVAQDSEDVLGLKETKFDFGKIPQGKPVTHTFEVVNKGKDALKISNVTASCGCTTPEWERDKAIEPDGSTHITVGYNAAAPGPFTKTITITYNDAKTKVITITGEVWTTPNASAPENKALSDLN